MAGKESVGFTINKMVNDIPVAVLLLNSAWSAGTDMGRIVLGERQVRDALKHMHDPTILFALMHHPISYLAEFDAVEVRWLLNTRCDFVLHGQIHDSGALTLRYPDSGVFYLAAGSLHPGRKELMSYNFVSLDLEMGIGKLFLREYSDRRNVWIADTIMYGSAQEGVIEFRLPARITKKARPPNVREIHALVEQLTPQAARKTKRHLREPPDVPDPSLALVKEIREGRCVLFAGSGASVDAQLPTWPELGRRRFKGRPDH